MSDAASNSDPLEALMVDAESLDRAAVADALAGYVGIDKASKEVVTQPSFKELPQPAQVVPFLLGVKTAVLLGVQNEEGRSPSEVSRHTGVPAGTVRRILPELAKKRLVSQDAEGRYFIAHHQVQVAIEAIGNRTSR